MVRLQRTETLTGYMRYRSLDRHCTGQTAEQGTLLRAGALAALSALDGSTDVSAKAVFENAESERRIEQQIRVINRRLLEAGAPVAI